MFCFPSLQARRAAGEELLPEEDPTVMKPVRRVDDDVMWVFPVSLPRGCSKAGVPNRQPVRV